MALTTKGMSGGEPQWERLVPAYGPFEPLNVTDLRFSSTDDEGPVSYIQVEDDGTIHACAGGGYLVYPGGESEHDGPQIACNDLVTAVRVLKESQS